MPAFYSLWTITTVHTFIFHPIQSSSNSQLLSDLEPVMGKMEGVANSAHSFAPLFLSYLHLLPLPAAPLASSSLEQGQGSEKTEEGSEVITASVLCRPLLNSICPLSGTPLGSGLPFHRRPLPVLQSSPCQPPHPTNP